MKTALPSRYQRGVFTRGESPWRYLKPLNANLFLSANEADVRSALERGLKALGAGRAAIIDMRLGSVN